MGTETGVFGPPSAGGPQGQVLGGGAGLGGGAAGILLVLGTVFGLGFISN